MITQEVPDRGRGSGFLRNGLLAMCLMRFLYYLKRPEREDLAS